MLIMNEFMYKLFQDFFTPTKSLSKKLDCVSLGVAVFLGVSCLLEALPWGDCTCAEWFTQ